MKRIAARLKFVEGRSLGASAQTNFSSPFTGGLVHRGRHIFLNFAIQRRVLLGNRLPSCRSHLQVSWQPFSMGLLAASVWPALLPFLPQYVFF